jgi:hypothetical protein
MYDRRWEKFSLGKVGWVTLSLQKQLIRIKLSAMREAAFVRELYEAGVGKAHWLYMGT